MGCYNYSAILCLGTVAPVFSNNELSEEAENKTIQVAITKELIMPEGTTTPGVAFFFSFTKVSVDGNDTSGDIELVPPINLVCIPFFNSDKGNHKDGVVTISKIMIQRSLQEFYDIAYRS